MTNSLQRRISEHKNREGFGFCRKYHIDQLVYFEHHETRSMARKKEKQLKRWHRSWKEKLTSDFESGMERSLRDDCLKIPALLPPLQSAGMEAGIFIRGVFAGAILTSQGSKLLSPSPNPGLIAEQQRGNRAGITHTAQITLPDLQRIGLLGFLSVSPAQHARKAKGQARLMSRRTIDAFKPNGSNTSSGLTRRTGPKRSRVLRFTKASTCLISASVRPE